MNLGFTTQKKMRNILPLLICFILISSCNNNSKIKYINVENQKRYSEIAFNEIKKNFDYKIIDKKNINDSVIINFKLSNSEKLNAPSMSNKLNLLSLIDTKFNLINLEKIKDLKKNKPSVINFWFTSCFPCILEMPYLEKMRNKYSENINFIGITFNSKEEIEKFEEKYKFNFKHITVDKNKISEFGVISFPKTFFIDSNGIIKNYVDGMNIIKDENGKIKIDENDNEIEEEIKKLLQ
jgi:cytochrome c biogenesis protein CcmG/thiol:disulfide interchange protein DsbE